MVDGVHGEIGRRLEFEKKFPEEALKRIEAKIAPTSITENASNVTEPIDFREFGF